MTIRFIMVGGFLGAGKTTTIGRLAKAYQARGLKVGIVTNDQATDLVDTHTLRSQGFDVGEVAGACFCCNFDELTKTTDKLSADNCPDIILAEPVGSCTDLVATVVQPLRRLFNEQFDVAPYGVILKPSHGRKILKNEQGSGFSPKAAYIFKKQLEEADFIILNRIDELTVEETSSLVELVQAENPNIPIIRMSAKSGAGFDALLEMLDQRGSFGKRILELDYDIYAEGEAELGWLNSSLQVISAQPIDLDKVLVGIIDRLRDSLAAIGAETAHLKTIGLWEGFYGVANLISSDNPAVLSLPSNCQTQDADVVVNARVAVDPVILEKLVHEAVNAACKDVGAEAKFKQTQSFRPGRPVPTHRFADAV
ncbi:MAG: cobalamin synthesis protein [Planctomycetaceae bacterium]|nr:cobalamin synthesis protein [Planctomycetaceae bacterium]